MHFPNIRHFGRKLQAVLAGIRAVLTGLQAVLPGRPFSRLILRLIFGPGMGRPNIHEIHEYSRKYDF